MLGPIVLSSCVPERWWNFVFPASVIFAISAFISMINSLSLGMCNRFRSITCFMCVITSDFRGSESSIPFTFLRPALPAFSGKDSSCHRPE